LKRSAVGVDADQNSAAIILQEKAPSRITKASSALLTSGDSVHFSGAHGRRNGSAYIPLPDHAPAKTDTKGSEQTEYDACEVQGAQR